MPLSSSPADALSVVTIILVALLILLGLSCVIYTSYFHVRIRSLGFVQLNYFGGPWIIRIAYIFVVIWWGVGEISRLSLLRRKGWIFGSLNLKWQENVCLGYIVSSMGFAEPCLFLTLIFLLRASLQKSGPLTQKWNVKTACHIILFGFPMLILQLAVILIGPKFMHTFHPRLSSYFYEASSSSSSSSQEEDLFALCTYPLLSTILLGLFATVLTCYLLWLGRRILHHVINKGLQRRVFTLILSSYSLFPLRVILLGLSVLPKPETVVFDAIVFLAFLSLLCCVVLGIFLLVYLPIADSLPLMSLPRPDIEARRSEEDDPNDNILLIPNESHLEENPGRDSYSSANGGSISFRSMGKDESSVAGFVELSLFATSQNSSSPYSPRPLGWRMSSQDQRSSDDDTYQKEKLVIVNDLKF